MIPPSNPDHGFALAVIETGFTLIGIATAFCCPRLGSKQFLWIESALKRVARRKHLAIAVSGLSVLVLRIALLPLFPIPLPFIHDDFSFLLASDTFASGRLTNPTPLMWTHLESFHITMSPTYMSMYFPAQGLILAAGKVLLGHPWFGILIVDALMCSALCWMMQAWLPPTWAFLGAMLAVLRLGLFSYWINTYTGGGFIAALGGALVLGSLPRLMRGVRLRYGVLMAIGIVILATSRPYEGLLLCVPVAIYLGHWLLFGTNRPSPSKLFRCAALPVLLVISAGAWMAYYDYRVFGNPLTLPYAINRATYAVAPYYVWQSPRPEPVYRHEVMRDFYTRDEYKLYKDIHTPLGYVPVAMQKLMAGILFFAGFLLAFPLIMVRRVLMDRRVRFLVICMFLLMAGMAIEIFLIPHYLAPFTVVFYALGLQAMRHLRVWRPGGQPIGLAVVRFTVLLCCAMGVLRVSARPLHIIVAQWPVAEWAAMWYGPDHNGAERAQIEDKLEHLVGKQLVLVRYSAGHNSQAEWVYNSADIDNSKVIWAREMDAAENARLVDYYSGRKVWLVQPDLQQDKLSSYPISEKLVAARQ